MIFHRMQMPLDLELHMRRPSTKQPSRIASGAPENPPRLEVRARGCSEVIIYKLLEIY